MSVLYNPWHEVISRLRTNKGLTQERAAAEAGVATNTWNRWEKSGFTPSDKQLRKILKALDVEAHDLGAMYSLALSTHYFPVDDENEDQGEAAAVTRLGALTSRRAVPPAEGEPERPTHLPPRDGGYIDGGPFANSVLDRVAGEPFEPETFPDFISDMVSKFFVVVAATTRIMVDMLIHYPRFKEETTDQEHANVLELWRNVHRLHSLCLSVSSELHTIEMSLRSGGEPGEVGDGSLPDGFPS